MQGPFSVTKMPSSHNIVFSSEADDDLRQIAAYTLEQWGEVQADLDVDAIVESIDMIRFFPQRGALRSDASGFRWIPAGFHSVYYLVEDQTIVVRILHRRRNVGPT